MWDSTKDAVSVFTTNLKREEKRPNLSINSDMFSGSSRQKLRQKTKWWHQFGPGGGAGVGCGAGVGFGLSGGFGFALEPWNELVVIHGVGVGCGVGVGYGFGFGWGVRWDKSQLIKKK